MDCTPCSRVGGEAVCFEHFCALAPRKLPPATHFGGPRLWQHINATHTHTVLPLQRIWCLFEVYQTISLPRSGQFEGLLLCTSTGVLQQGKAGADVAVAVAKTVAELDTRTAEATAEEDRLMIHSLIEQMPGGFDTMNSFVRDTICNALEASHLHYESTLKDLMHTLASNSSTAPAPLPTLLTSSAAYRPNKADTSPDRVCSIDPV